MNKTELTIIYNDGRSNNIYVNTKNDQDLNFFVEQIKSMDNIIDVRIQSGYIPLNLFNRNLIKLRENLKKVSNLERKEIIKNALLCNIKPEFIKLLNEKDCHTIYNDSFLQKLFIEISFDAFKNFSKKELYKFFSSRIKTFKEVNGYD